MIDRARESRNPKKVIRVTVMESYGEIGRVPVNLFRKKLRTWGRGSAPPGNGTAAASGHGRSKTPPLLRYRIIHDFLAGDFHHEYAGFLHRPRL